MKHAAKQVRAAAHFALFVTTCSLCHVAPAAGQTILGEVVGHSGSTVSTASSSPDAPATAAASSQADAQAVANGNALPTPANNVASALQGIAAQAGVIFTGSVTDVRADSKGTSIIFAVEQGIRGAATGGTYTMHLSAWGGGPERFFPGQRALFLLTAPSVAGYSSPVLGQRGIVPLTGDALAGNVDLRWVAADVQRNLPALEASSTAPRTHAALVSAASGTHGNLQIASTAGQTSTGTAAGSATLPDVHSIDRDLVLDLLRASQTSTSGQTR